jgi:N-acetylglucosaminyldiphosphoundecaprenol N-acetyl-beta-D-mannosaminyltransferase
LFSGFVTFAAAVEDDLVLRARLSSTGSWFGVGSDEEFALTSYADMVAAVPTVTVGGFSVSALDRQTAAALMIRAAAERAGKGRPLYFTSVNGEVIARATQNPEIRNLFSTADQILADGQPLVLASRWLCRVRLPERVATTDLFHDVARLAERTGTSFYMLGADEEENRRAVAAVRAAYPRLNLVGHSHGYLKGAALEAKVDEINRLTPDILWLGLGVPLEQRFVRDFSGRLGNVGVIKTSGGLFNFLSGKNPRAPSWMQKAGFEWLWRMLIEPRRLFWRYLTTNPRALYALVRYSE